MQNKNNSQDHESSFRSQQQLVAPPHKETGANINNRCAKGTYTPFQSRKKHGGITNTLRQACTSNPKEESVTCGSATNVFSCPMIESSFNNTSLSSRE